MKYKLQDIGTLSTGVYRKPYPGGDTLYLQLKHFSAWGHFQQQRAFSPDLELDASLARHLLEDEDLLIATKGEHNRVCLYREQMGQAVASSTFCVLRLRQPGVLPSYLQWYLNTPHMQARLHHLSKGSHILSISKKALAGLEVHIPSLARQKEILHLQSLWLNERQTTLDLLEQKALLYQNLLISLATSNSSQHD